MKPGETAVIAGFEGNSIQNRELTNKLLEMGFLPGAAIRFNFSAPLGDPVCVSVGSTDISLRLSEAMAILILE